MEVALIKLLLPVLIKFLIDSGVMSKIEGDAISDLGDFVMWAKSLRTYQEYPSEDSKGQS